MRWEKLPESDNVDDRRGEKPARTITEMAEQAKRRKPAPLGAPDPANAKSDLAKDLGIDDIGK